MKKSIHRRAFMKTTAAAGLGLGLTGPFSIARGAQAPNEKVVVGVMGIRSRGQAVAEAFARATGAEVGYLIDVDERYFADAVKGVSAIQGKAPKTVVDFRTLLDGSDIDALVIATPDHWHAPASIMAMQAGKDVYVEKPCGHNPAEGEMLVAAQQKTGRVIQMGTQQRSSPYTMEAIEMIREGAIGRPYFGKAWYANTRGPIGRGQPSEVPSYLNWELWQGPAPRTQYQEIYHPYNWHWFWRWGTGESCNNGTHEVDVCRWVLGVDYPERAVSSGGRYHYDDDWQFYDTQVMSFDFPGEKTITWEGRSCNGLDVHDRDRGAAIMGTEGSVILDRDGYVFYDLDGKETGRKVHDESTDALNTVGADYLTDLHVQNFVDAVRTGVPLNQPIDSGHKSVLLCHLGNIAQRTGKALTIDPATGHIVGDPEAIAFWSREYAPGWTPTV